MSAIVFGSREAAELLKADRAAVEATEKRERLAAAERSGKLMRDNGWNDGEDANDVCDHLFAGSSQTGLCGAHRLTGQYDEWRSVWGGTTDTDDLCDECQAEYRVLAAKGKAP